MFAQSNRSLLAKEGRASNQEVGSIEMEDGFLN